MGFLADLVGLAGWEAVIADPDQFAAMARFARWEAAPAYTG